MKKSKPIMINWLIKSLFIILLTTSCQDNTLYHSYQPVKATGWEKNDTIVLAMPQKLISQPYQYEIGIRHKDSYKYRDLWLQINQDTIHLYLADTIGNWKGKGIGNMRQLVFPIRLKSFQQDSIQEFRIHHIMQDNPLLDIHDVGIQIKLP